MSVQTLYTAATGMQALETKLDVIANNLANVNTNGFKKGRVNFEDLFYRHEVLPGTEQNGTRTATGTSIGLGTRVSSVQIDHKQGAFQQTGNALDVAIEGGGFFQVTDPLTSETLYTRSGNFAINANGDLVLGSGLSGRPLSPAINIPEGSTNISIALNGQVSYQTPGQTPLSQAGTLQMANFINPQGLLKIGENLFRESDASGTASPGDPGSNGLGVVVQNALEASNVEPVQELIDLITTQRSFELNSQAVQAGDQVLQQIANLRRS
ncbi:MAG TPA: flagellar basal-body rod protein FlgG [Pirellulaceae bacterium]|jgi:flagellar basal-body rod protein FlgG|nr:flagellar basal-body rod protein FlgG [Pirellulaceae bacterium]